MSDVRVGVSGGTSTPVRLKPFEDKLRGAVVDTASLGADLQQALQTVEVFGDQHYPEDYRRHLLQVMALQSLTQAIEDCEARRDH